MVVYTLEQRWEILQQIDLQKMPILAKEIIFSDEAHFDLGEYVNKQNCRIWGAENPHAYIEKPMHPKRVTVWCTLRVNKPAMKKLLKNLLFGVDFKL